MMNDTDFANPCHGVVLVGLDSARVDRLCAQPCTSSNRVFLFSFLSFSHAWYLRLHNHLDSYRSPFYNLNRVHDNPGRSRPWWRTEMRRRRLRKNCWMSQRFFKSLQSTTYRLKDHIAMKDWSYRLRRSLFSGRTTGRLPGDSRLNNGRLKK
jgi:hypothetical protein